MRWGKAFASTDIASMALCAREVAEIEGPIVSPARPRAHGPI